MQVGGGVGLVHGVHVFDLPVARGGQRVARGVEHRLAAAGDVQHLHPCRGQLRQPRGDGRVDARRRRRIRR